MNSPNIAVIGKMGSGKTTVAELLVEHFHYRRLAFAGTHPGGVRDVAVRMWGTAAQNDRDKLQALGMFGRQIDQDTWVRNAVAQLNDKNRLPDGPIDDDGHALIDHPVVVDDMRFPNEAWELKGRDFIVVRVVAPRHIRIARLRANGKLTDEAQLDHESEKQLDSWPEDYTLHNDTNRRAAFNQITTILHRENK